MAQEIFSVTKTAVQIADDGQLGACDTIEHEGKLWLVPKWHGNFDEGIEWPERIICVHGLPMNPRSLNYDADRELLIPLSRATLDGSVTQGLVVIEKPKLFRRLGKPGTA
jgi:hypothetical protein